MTANAHLAAIRAPGRRSRLRPSTPRRGGKRWLRRRFQRYRPVALLFLSIVFLLAAAGLDFVPSTRGWLEAFADSHEVMLGLALNLAVAGFAAAVAYYAFWGDKHQKALKRYREVAKNSPHELVDWSVGEADLVRRDLCRVLADEIEGSPEPAIVVVRGRAGSGRASMVTRLVRELAARNLIPVPVLTQPDATFDPYELARKKFCRHVDPVLGSEGEADAIWRRARSTHDLVLLLDGVDDEIVDDLSSEAGKRFRAALDALLKQRIAVVLATSREPLGSMLGRTRVVREDLDLFGWAEAERHLRAALDDSNETTKDALEALKRLRPVDGFRVTPFYLDLICRLVDVGAPLGPLPEHTDRWRSALLAKYLDSAVLGQPIGADAHDEFDARQAKRDRGRSAVALAEAAARQLQAGRNGLTCTLDDLQPEGSTLRDAVALNLLWHGQERVGFTGDDLGAYLVASTLDDPAPLMDAVCGIGQQRGRIRREDRHVLRALTFWHLRHKHERESTFEHLLAEFDRQRAPRPSVVATAVRIAAACDLGDPGARLSTAARRSVDWMPGGETERTRKLRAPELVRLVRALTEWRVPSAHMVLWQLATDRHVEVEWPAAKALALAVTDPYPTLAPMIDRDLLRAEAASAPDLSEPKAALGNTVASLAWILPALRTADDRAERQLARVTKLCLADDMSSLRGEMSLCQGLKLAAINGRAPEPNIEHICKLLFDRDRPLRFWHARLLLVQATLAHASRHGKEAAKALEPELRRLRRREPHALVKAGIDLARQGLRAIAWSPDSARDASSSYMWVHEREAVQWVEQGKGHAARLAADSVLVSNMLYRLREVDASRAELLASNPKLPRCIRRSHDRHEIAQGCDCPHGLCTIARDAPAVLATRAPFSETFCREQSRLVARYGAPRWAARGLPAIYRRRRGLVEFWDEQAAIAQKGPTGVLHDGE